MKKLLVLAGCLLLVFGISVQAKATLINFDEIAAYTPVVGANITPVPASVITDTYMNVGVLFGAAGQSTGVAVVRDSLAPSSEPNSVAGLDASGILPGSAIGGAIVGDIYFNFVLPGTSTAAVTNSVSFTIGDNGGDLDVFQIRGYDLIGQLISTQDLSGISRFPVSINIAGIHSVVVDFTGDYGYSLDDLNFNTPSAAPVPEPSTMLLLGSGLIGLAGYGRKKFFKK